MKNDLNINYPADLGMDAQVRTIALAMSINSALAFSTINGERQQIHFTGRELVERAKFFAKYILNGDKDE